MQGTFRRVSPAAFAERVGIPAGWVVVSYRWMPDKSQRRRSHGRWFKIESEKATVFRILRFSAQLSGSPKVGHGQLVVDWPAWLQLHGYEDNVDPPLELKFTRVGWWAFPILAISHPDPTIRLTGALGVLSFGLGVLSVVLAIVAL